MKRLFTEEKGQAFPLALIALVLGGLLVGSYLTYTSTNLIASRVLGRLVTGQCTADAGVEDALWNLVYGDMATVFTAPGESVTYSLTESVNQLNPDVAVTMNGDTVAVVASDDFESGDWAGGSGWLDDWYQEGDAEVASSPSTYEGDYHLVLKAGTGYASRAVDLVDKGDVHLKFWAEARSFEAGETANCLISHNGTDWTTVHTWEDGDDDDAYHLFEIDLSPYTLSSEFWVAFEANMSAGNDYLYVDALSVVTVLSSAAVLPSDGFETGDWSGGTGWLADWQPQGSSQITKSEVPYEGHYHLEMAGPDGYVERAAGLSGQSGLHLQFWAEARSLESTDEISCLLSSDGSLWNTARSWSTADSDDSYHFYDIDLSAYTMSSQFWIAFDWGAGGKNDYFYVDQLRIVDAVAYKIVASASTETITTTVSIEDGQATILSWQIE